MAKHRNERINEEVMRATADIVRELKDPRIPVMTSIVRVEVTPDLKFAKVYVSVMGHEGGPAPVVQALNGAAGHVRTELSRKMHIRKAPRLVFVEDDGAAYAAHINQLLKDLKLDEDGPTEDA